jgi:hypothetical protein
VLCQTTFILVFRAGFLHSETAQFNLECMGPFIITIDDALGTRYCYVA